MSKFRRKSGGFTLVELVVAMFLMSLVSLIGVSVTMMVSASQKNYKVNAQTEGEILDARDAFKDWLMGFDTSEYTVTVTSSDITIAKGTEKHVITLKNGALVLEIEDGALEQNCEVSASEITFLASDRLILCKIKFEETGYEHRILYTMRAAKVEFPTEAL